MTTTETMNEIGHDHLAAAVGTAAKFCPGARCPKPVLRTVLVRCDDDGTTATATDLEHRVIVRLDGGAGRGVALVPVEAARAMGKAGGPGVVRFADSTVSAGGITATMDDPLEYPAHPLCGLPATAAIRFDHAEVIAKAVSVATDNESSRFALGGIRLEIEGGRVLAVGTDGRRMHVAKVPNLIAADGPLDVNAAPVVFAGIVRAVRDVAREVLGLRGRRLEDALAASTVEIRRSASDCLVEARWSCDGATVAVQAREIEARFPRWRDCFPDGCWVGNGITLDVAAGTAQMKAAARVVTDFRPSALFADGQVTAGHESTGIYSAEVAGSMNCPAIRLDPSFVADALAAAKTVGCTAARFIVKDAQSAVFMHANDGHANCAILHVVIMPMAAD